jgi:hypothetical protein
VIRRNQKADALLVIVENGQSRTTRLYGKAPAALKRHATKVMTYRRVSISGTQALFIETRKDGRMFEWAGFMWVPA